MSDSFNSIPAPKVSVGIPFYNNARTLELAIKSVLSQTYDDFELILLSDGSTDASLEIARRYASNNRIRLIEDPDNRGLIYRLNQLVDLSNGELIARMDADDIMMPDRLEKQVEAFIINSKLDVVGTSIYSCDEHNLITGVRDYGNHFNFDFAIRKALFCHPSVMAKKDWFVANKYKQDYERAEDYELWCRTVDESKFFNLSNRLLIYREGSVNIKSYVKSNKTLRAVFRDYQSRLGFWARLKLHMMTYIKSAIYLAFGALGKQSLLSSSRNHTLDLTERKKVQQYVDSLIEKQF